MDSYSCQFYMYVQLYVLLYNIDFCTKICYKTYYNSTNTSILAMFVNANGC